MKNKKGFCYEIFKNLAFWSRGNSISYNPCSLYSGFIDTNIDAHQCWTGKNRQAVIKLVEENKQIPGCSSCYHEEQNGRKSRRQNTSENYEKFLGDSDIEFTSGPVSIDYSVGNLCNLKCVICGPDSSTAWIPDYQKIFPDSNLEEYKYKKQNVTELIDNNFLTNIRSIHFHGGGEPLMSDAHINLLKRVEQTRGLSDVRIFYNTNATQTVSDEVLKLWEKCLLVELYFSIDDVGERFEYQRTGAQWKDIQKNIDWFKNYMPHNHMFNVNCVWSYLNLYYLDELVDWHKENFHANRYGDPCQLIFQKAKGIYAINHLNETAIRALERKFVDYPQLTKLLTGIATSNHSHRFFWNSISKLDKIRGVDFNKLCPEWSEFL